MRLKSELYQKEQTEIINNINQNHYIYKIKFLFHFKFPRV